MEENQGAHGDMDEDWVEEDEDEEHGRMAESTPLLPIFSASHLGMRPFYLLRTVSG